MDFDVIFAPMTPRNLDAVIGDRRIELLWDAPHPNGAVISSYTVRYRAIPTETETWTPATDVSSTATRYVIPNLSNGQKYEFEVFAIGTAYSNSLYSYAAKTGGKAKVIAAPQGNLYGDPEPEFDEIIDPASAWNDSISKYEKSGTVTWTLTGDDHLLLELLGTESGFRTLHFKSAPDFENALDADSDNVYEVTVNALPVSTGSRAVTPFTLDVSVEVTNVEEKGSVSFSHRDPVAGETLVATVTDPDEINEGSLGWEWNRNWTPFNPSSYEDFKHEKLPHITTGSFDVTGDDVGWTFGVIVSYTDGFSPENRITLDRQTTSITKGPIIPLASAPLPEGSAAVVLGAVVNDADGNPITQGVTWSLDLDRGDEQQDEAEFTISADGALRFKEPPNYEQPTSSVDATATLAERNVYTAQLVASVGNVSIKGTATVTVTDVDEDGTVTLSTTTPVVGAEVTAALEDPDVPVTNELWTWQRRLPDSETVEDARAPLQSLDDLFQPTFTPSVLDVGRELRASVSYRDVHSSSDGFGLSLLDKSAHSVWTEPVSHGPTYLQVVTETELGGLQFVLSTCPLPLREPGPECPAPTGGLLFTLDHVGLERCTGPSSDETCVEFTGADLVELVTGGIPSGVPGERSSQARGRVSSSLTFSAPVAAVDNRLDNRKTYRFRAYLVGPGEQESPKSDAVTVLGLRPEARAGAVGLSWDAPAGLTGITGWSYRYTQEDGTWDADSWEPTGTGATATTVEVEGLTNGVSYEFQVRALLGAETGPESFVVSATPERPDTPGRMEWSTTQPRVGQELTPTLIDPDNPALAEARWRWRRQRWSRSDAGDSLSAPVPGSRSGESKLGVIARTRQYTPRVSDLHQWLWVEVTYTDDFDRHRVSATTSRAVGPGPPCAPANLKAAPGDGQVTLTWEAGCDNGGTIDRYQYRRPGAVKWVRVTGDGSARRQQVTGLTNGEAHTFEVRARNGQGWGPAAQATATPAAAESPPPPPPPPLTVTYGASSYSAQEGGEAATVTVRLSPSASEALSIPITVNPPSGDFTVAGLTDGALSFSSGAERQTFTVTADQDDDTVDETVLLGFGDLPEEVSAGTPASATVTLFDDDVVTPVVSLSTTTPQVGQRMTATLTHLDGGLEAVAWQWQRRADAGSAWETLEQTARYPITDLSRYTPVAADVGKQLRATVSYTDAHGASKSVQSAATDPVTWPSLTVFFSSSTYQATEGGEAATVTVRLSPPAFQALRIPIAVNPPSGDFAVAGLTDGGLSFAPEADEATFTVTASEDADTVDETVTLGFGTPLPEGVSAGDPGSATVTLVDDDPDEDDPDDDSDDPVGTPGEVRLSTASPQVGRELTATLVEVDGGLDAVAWQWQRRADASSGWVPIERSARIPIAATSRYTPVTADRGQQLRATVSYTDAHGPDSAQSEATEPVTWPSLTVFFSSSTYQATEGGEAPTVTVRLSPSASEALRIPIAVNPPSGDFAVAGLTDGGLSFAPEADEATFTVTASEDADTVDETVTLGFGTPLPEGVSAGDPGSATVTLVDDDPDEDDPDDDSDDPVGTPGEVRLSTASPQVGRELTATLVDVDGGLDAVAWQWQRRADASSGWVPIERSARIPIAATSRYTPVTADRGQQLRATVGYTDAHGPGKSAQSEETDPVTKPDTPGEVRLSTSSPEVDQRVTATLTDFDGGLEAVAWQWQQRADAGSAWVPIERSPRYPIVDQSHYTPVAADRGKQLRATVGYTDAHGPGKSAQSAASSSVRPADTPGTVRLSTSSPEVDQRVTATLTDFDGGLEAVAWQWQQRADAGSAWVPIERSPRYPIVDQSHYTPVAADRGKQLRATVGYTDAHGPDKSAQSDATAAVKAPNRPPVIDDTGTQSVPENTRSVATFTATDPEGQAITWSVIGNVFQISSSGEVSFQNAPSYESGTTSYSLTVRATDPKGASDTETVTVNVTDVDEPPGPPSNVRVSAAGRTSVEVEWDAPNTSGRPPVTDYDVQYRASGNWRTHSFSGTGTSTTISSLTPNTAYEVQVNAANDEGTSGWAAGSGRTDCGAPTISGPTSQSIPENTTAVASYTLSDPDGGGGRWLPLGGADASAFNFSGGTLSFRSAPDYETDSRQYQVTIRARGGCSSSSSASRAVTVSVRNVGPPGKPTVTVTVPATNGHEELDVGWSTSASDAPVTGWKLQYCQTNACSSTTTLPFDAGTTSTTLENLRSGTRYSVRVKATSDEGDSPWSAIRRTYTRANTAPVISGTGRQNVNENTTAVGTYTATDAEGDGITWDIYSTDSDEFSFTSSGSSLTLRFESAPDYEDPTDANTNNIYVVRIRATDDANPSANSNKLINAIVQDIGPPSRMTDVRVSVPSSGTGRLDVNWSAPASGAPVTGYTMKYCYASFRSEEDPPEDPDDEAARQAVCAETTVGRVTSTTLTGLHENTLYTVFLKATSREGTSGSWSTPGSAITRSAAAKALAEQMALTGLDGLAALAAPNPFNPSTTIYFQVPESGEVSLAIYSLAGQVVKTLIPGRTLKAGIYDVFWEGRDEQGRPVAAGVYFYRLRVGDKAIVRKMTLLR